MLSSAPNSTIKKYTGELSWDDWYRKYMGTYVRVLIDGTYIPCYISSAGNDDDPTKFLIELVKADGSITTVEYNKDEIDLSIPAFGMCAINDKLVYADRVPLRQWNEALSSQWLRCSSFHSTTGLILNLSRKAAYVLLSNLYYTAEDALIFLRGGTKAATPLSQHWGLFVSDEYRDIMIAYKTHLVGYVADDDSLVLLPFANHLLDGLLSLVSVPVLTLEDTDVCQSK